MTVGTTGCGCTVYTDEGKFVKVLGSKTWHSLSPRGLVRVDDLVYIALKGDKEGGIPRYKLKSLNEKK